MPDLTANEMQELNLNRYLQLIAFTILMQEYCLTFTREVERFWIRGKVTLVDVLFFVNRYFVPLGHVPVLFHNFWISKARNKQIICHRLQFYHYCYAVMVQVIISAILILRTYALYERSNRVLAMTAGVPLALTVVAWWGIISKPAGDTTHPPMEYFVVDSCASSISQTRALRFAIDWGGLLVFDALIFGLTLHKTLLLLRSGYASTLITLMLRDGSMYFGVMVLSNVPNVLTFVYGGPFIKASSSIFVNNISSVMIARLMLNMRDPELRTVFGTTTISFPTFAERMPTEMGGRHQPRGFVSEP